MASYFASSTLLDMSTQKFKNYEKNLSVMQSKNCYEIDYKNKKCLFLHLTYLKNIKRTVAVNLRLYTTVHVSPKIKKIYARGSF